MGNIEYSGLTEKIIGCAYRVYNRMGFGFLESVYEKCMLIELPKEGLNAESQKPITVYYEDKVVGEFVADIIVNDTVILELKSPNIWYSFIPGLTGRKNALCQITIQKPKKLKSVFKKMLSEKFGNDYRFGKKCLTKLGVVVAELALP